jgi:hypothetical protein
MPDTRVYYANGNAQLANPGNVARAVSPDQEQHFASSPSGIKLGIPAELFLALSDFIKTRKSSGSITVQFRSGEIVCVEALTKKTYR